MRRKGSVAALTLTCLATLGLLGMAHPQAHAQDDDEPSPAVEKLGPVGQEEAKPLKASPPVSDVVDPGVIPSRQGITPAGFQSVFESRVNGVAFGENGDSIYAAVLGQKGSLLYQIDLKTNRMLTMVGSSASTGMQGLVYDPVAHTPLMSGLSGSARRGRTPSVQLVALSGQQNTRDRR